VVVWEKEKGRYRGGLESYLWSRVRVWQVKWACQAPFVPSATDRIQPQRWQTRCDRRGLLETTSWAHQEHKFSHGSLLRTLWSKHQGLEVTGSFGWSHKRYDMWGVEVIMPLSFEVKRISCILFKFYVLLLLWWLCH
jgi:hypothetical protein